MELFWAKHKIKIWNNILSFYKNNENFILVLPRLLHLFYFKEWTHSI